MEAVIASTIVLGMPLLIAAIAGIIAERSGVINVALEGLMLIAAFTAAWAAGGGRSTLAGFAGAIAVAALLGLALGALAGALAAWRVVQVAPQKLGER